MDTLTAFLSGRRFFLFLAGVLEFLRVQTEKIFYFQAATFLYPILHPARKRHKKRATEKTATL
jgi:hypothetical protein